MKGKSTSQKKKKCSLCGKDAQFMCSSCGSQVNYCSQECQREHWPTHRRECKAGRVDNNANNNNNNKNTSSSSSSRANNNNNDNNVVGITTLPSLGNNTTSSKLSPISNTNYNDNYGNQPVVNSSRASSPSRVTKREIQQHQANEEFELQDMNRFVPSYRNTAQGFQTPSTFSSPSIAFNNNNNNNGNGSQNSPIDVLDNPDNNNIHDGDEEAKEKADDILYYMTGLYTIIKPVMACILLSVFWVKVTTRPSGYFGYIQLEGGVGKSIGSVFTGGKNDSQSVNDSINTALIFLGQLVGATFVIFLLFKYNCMKLLTGLFGLLITFIFGFFGYFLGTLLFSVYNAPFDKISFIILLWNISVLGVISIFYKAPLWLQQIYLVVMSSLMALSLTSLPDLATWLLLALLVVWDLVAVLCPFGPLKLLIEHSKKNNKEIPALLYSTAIWMMANPPERYQRPPSPSVASGSTSSSRFPAASSVAFTEDQFKLNKAISKGSFESHAVWASPADSITPLQGSADNDRDIENSQMDPEVEQEEEEESGGMKLGLGDFVFYSVLVARAAMYDWVTTVSCTVAVTAGLSITIFLLAIYRKALPALPISITFGILFYFVSSIMLTPYANRFLQVPQYNSLLVASGTLWISTQGSGYVIP